MTIKGLYFRYLWFMLNHVYVGVSHFEEKRRIMGKLGFQVGEGTRVVGPLHCTGKLTIGKNCWIGKNFMVNGYGEVSIGDNCDIAPGVSIQTGSHLIGTSDRRAGEITEKDVMIGSGTWICANATLIGGVEVGKGCVIAACACVNKNIESNTLVAGVPAKLIRSLKESI